MRTMHLFAGAGGGLLADLILGHTPVVAVEWEPYACQVLRERAAEGWFPDLRVWEGDVRLFDPSKYAGSVDCIHAGFPCQDLSVAGNQAGLGEGTRSGLYREVLRIAGVVRPRYLFLENVSAILSGGLETVFGDLAARGYDCRWCCLEASGVGAPHRRDRWWLLATMADTNGMRKPQPQVRKRKERGWVGDGGCQFCGYEFDVEKLGIYGCPNCEGEGLESADPILERLEGQQQGWTEARATDRPGNWRDPGWWQAEPGVGRVVDGLASRVDRLKCLGNGQVPIQAAVAWKILGGE